MRDDSDHFRSFGPIINRPIREIEGCMILVVESFLKQTVCIKTNQGPEPKSVLGIGRRENAFHFKKLENVR